MLWKARTPFKHIIYALVLYAISLKKSNYILDIGNSRQAKSRLKKDGVITNDVIDNLGRKQKATFINESNFYKLVFQSRKPQAEKFTDWVTDEVLPAIRQTGRYESEKPTYKLTQKTFKGKNVMTLRDLEYVIGIDRTIIYKVSRTNQRQGYLLEGDELEEFKKRNPSIPQKLAKLLIFDERQSRKLVRSFSFSNSNKAIDEYFYNKAAEEKTMLEILKITHLADDLQSLVIRKAKNTEYYKPLCLIISKMFYDVGLMDEITDNLDINYAPSWNLSARKEEYRRRLIELLG